MRKEFNEVYRTGRRRLRRLLVLPNPDGHILSLQAVLDCLPGIPQHYAGVQAVASHRIIGTVDRANDFAIGFLPITRTMDKRWSTIRDLYLDAQLNESLQLIEVGGCFFVQDGNHRVSVARTHTAGYLDAVVQRAASPVRLPPNLVWSTLPLLRAKGDFANRTTLFTYINEERFGHAPAEIWNRLERQVYHVSRLRLQQLLGFCPDDEQIAHRWDEEVLTPLMHILHTEALPTRFPRKNDLEILCDILDFRETLPTDASISEAAHGYLDRAAEPNPLPLIIAAARRRLQRVVASPEQERNRFFRISRMLVFRPGARVPHGSARWYRFLLDQLFVTHFGYLRQQLERKPMLDELVCDWHDNLFSPALRLYERQSLTKSFTSVYMHWMKDWHRRILRETKKRGYVQHIQLEDSFKEFIACNPKLMQKV